MKDRIAHIMRAKNLKASDFAAQLGIQPSAISHILAGRNNPSLEIVKKIKETFPEYNLDWIIFGTGPMTLSEPFKTTLNDPARESTLFDNEPIEEVPSTPTPVPPQPQFDIPEYHSSSSSIKSVMVFYDDGTFETYSPR